MNELKIGDIRYKEIGSYEEVYVITGFSSDGSPIWTLISNQPERSKREDLHHKDCIPWIKHDCWHGYDRRHLCKHKEDCDNIVGARMRCSEHCGNTVRDK